MAEQTCTYKLKIDLSNIYASDGKSLLNEEQILQYKCSVCEYLLNDPVQAECGDRFCLPCFKSMFTDNSHSKCPQCETGLESDQIFPDRGCKKEITALRKKCACGELICISDLEEHTNQVCPAAAIDCSYGCGEKFIKRDLDNHMMSCVLCPITCEYCKLSVPMVEITGLEHYERCEKYPSKCPHCEEEFKSLEQKQYHISSVCKKKQYPCHLCGFKGNAEDNVKHIEENHKIYLYNLVAFLPDITLRLEHLERERVTSSRIMQEKVDSQEKVINALLKNQDKLEKQVKGLEEKLIEVMDKSKKNREIEILSSKISKLEQDSKTRLKHMKDKRQYDFDEPEKDGQTGTKLHYTGNAADVEKMIESKLKTVKHDTAKQTESLIKEQELKILRLEERLKYERNETEKFYKMLQSQESNIINHNSLLQEIHLRQEILEVRATKGVFIWKINDLHRRKQDAYEGRVLSLYSPPFFTSSHGYRMCLRCYLNGDGSGRGTHLSVFFVVMRSELDDLLPWPFKQKVTISLLSQQTTSFDAHVTQSFIPDSKSSSFQKPTKEMNVASGFPKFAPKSVLDEKCFSDNDTIYFKVKVNLTDIPLD